MTNSNSDTDDSSRSCWQARRSLLVAAAQETTAHGLSRTVGDRHWLVRLLWLAAFLAVVSLLLIQLVDAVKKVQQKPVSTSVEPNAAQFEFPDIHVCSYPMVSASYSASMGPAERSYTDHVMTSIANIMAKANITGEELTRLTAQAFVGTVPYSFLSRNFGARLEQTVIGAAVMPVTVNLRLGVDIVNLHHYKYLNCFTLRVTNDTALRLLSNVMGYLDLSLYADATYNATLRLNNDTIDARGLSFVNYDYLIGAGFRLYFTERGKFPDDYSASVTVSTGFHHYISLSMSSASLAKEKGQCVSDVPDQLVLDQASLKAVAYNYSLGACYADAMSKVYSGIGCYLPGYAPVLYSDRDFPCCNNLSRLLAPGNASQSGEAWRVQLIQQLYNGALANHMVTSVQEMQSTCQNSKPCDETVYRPSVSSILFPLQQGLASEMTSIFTALTAQRNAAGFHVPGRDWMVGLFDAAHGNRSVPNTAAEQALTMAANENIVRIQIQAGELTSTRLSQTISYRLDDLPASVGGLMGLFMGGSFLTLMELVELGVFLLWGRRITAATAGQHKVAAVAAAAAAATAVGDHGGIRQELPDTAARGGYPAKSVY